MVKRNTTIISIINHKGGVGKTTSTVNIGAALAQIGKKVLVVDLDTQMNLTHSLIGELNDGDLTITEALLNKKTSVKDTIRRTNAQNLDIIPSGESMVNLELKLQSMIGREVVLKKVLDQLNGYDCILLDNPPHVGLTTLNSLVASHYYLVPLSAEYLPLVGIKHLIKTISEVQEVNEKLKNIGYLLTMVDKRESISRDVEEVIRQNFKNEVFSSVIRINTKLKGAPQHQKTIFEIEPPKGKGPQDYMRVAKEIIAKLENSQNGNKRKASK